MSRTFYGLSPVCNAKRNEMALLSRRAAGCLAAVAGFVLTMSSPCLAQSHNDQAGIIRDPKQLVQLLTGGYNVVVPARRDILEPSGYRSIQFR
jgi:hypothetical protein